MGIFGNREMDIAVKCEARINYSDTDIMFVLDTTGSMNEINPGDTVSAHHRAARLVQDFHDADRGKQSRPARACAMASCPMRSTSTSATCSRTIGWSMNGPTSRAPASRSGPEPYQQVDWTNWVNISGSISDAAVSSYPATYHAGDHDHDRNRRKRGHDHDPAWYSCDTSPPSNTGSHVDTLLSETNEPYAGPPAGTKNTKHYRRVSNGTDYWNSLSGTTCTSWAAPTAPTPTNSTGSSILRCGTGKPGVTSRSPAMSPTGAAKPRAAWKSATPTKSIRWTKRSISPARSISISIPVPTAGNPATQWRPMYPDIIWARALMNGNAEQLAASIPTIPTVTISTRPISRARRLPHSCANLAEMTTGEVNTYLSSLVVGGQTYHDIGMIWGGRLISPTGLFATENADRRRQADYRAT